MHLWSTQKRHERPIAIYANAPRGTASASLRLQVHRQKNSKTTGSYLYRASDIIYDIEHGRLAVEVTADEAAEITTPRPTHEDRHQLTHIT